jgi:diguanylate cyclase (GGDEF)-like protein
MEPTAKDHVTGLEPRAVLEAELAAALAAPLSQVAVTLVDCIGLKAVNEREGFHAGDDRLAAAAARLRAAAGAAAVVARLGGDELVAVFVGPGARPAAEQAARELLAPGMPPLRAVAAPALPGDTAATLVERVYAMLRRS